MTATGYLHRPHVEDGPSCPGCGLPNYSGLCPVCRGDEQAYRDELQYAFGPWHEDDLDGAWKIAAGGDA